MHRKQTPLAPRIPPASPRGVGTASPVARSADHHLWRNGRLWWIAITLYDVKGRRRRVRESLGSCDVVDARRERDRYLDRVRREGRWTFAASTLRVAGALPGVAA